MFCLQVHAVPSEWCSLVPQNNILGLLELELYWVENHQFGYWEEQPMLLTARAISLVPQFYLFIYYV